MHHYPLHTHKHPFSLKKGIMIVKTSYFYGLMRGMARENIKINRLTEMRQSKKKMQHSLLMTISVMYTNALTSR